MPIENGIEYFSLMSYTKAGANNIKKLYEEMGFKFLNRFGNDGIIIQDFEVPPENFQIKFKTKE